MARDVVWRMVVCRGAGCPEVFYICGACYRGQAYCGARCRAPAQRQHRRDANARHQRSPEGWLDHRDRQRVYRAISMCRKRPFATGGRGRRPDSAAVCRIPCLILCLAYVARKSMARRPMLASRQRSALFSLRLGFDATVDQAEIQEGENLRFLWHLQVVRHQHPQGEKPSRLPEHPYL